jgi:O-glycosyl hydrolase
LWNTIDYLHSKGIPDNQIILSNMGPGPSWNGGMTVSSSTQINEWAEMVVSEAYYGYTNGHTFGLFSPNNEQDISANEGVTMSGTVYGQAMNKVAQRLDALGLTNIRLLAPETATPNIYWDSLQPYPSVINKIDHFDFHSYTGNTNGADADIKAAYPDKNFWMSEFAVFDDSFDLLDQGASGLMMWDAYDSVYNHAIVNGHGSQPGNDQGNAPPQIAYNKTTKVYTPRKSFYQFKQLYKYVLPGMKRVSTNSSKASVMAHAFVNTSSGAITIVGYNTSSSQQIIGGTLTGTPASSVFHYWQTNSSSNMTQGTDVSISGGSYTVTVPADTVFTLTTL